MNLLDCCWLPVVRADGSKHQVAPWQIAESINPVIDLAAPRSDFQGALYQLLIGLLQTTFAPEDADEWRAYWQQSPKPDAIKTTFAKFSKAFELGDSDGPCFLQDFDMPDGESKPVEALLIEAPGGKTRRDNLDHFVKGGRVQQMCLSCAATALFTLQTNAPSGGVGHRVGLRGGGPLTTLVMPKAAITLWQKLWANVLTEDEFEEKVLKPENSVFPWLTTTRYSHKTGQSTMPDDVHPLQQYWGMPRRIRLNIESGKSCQCSMCGLQTQQMIKTFRTKNYGTNYDGPWVHQLTPYRFDLKKKQLPLSVKGQQGGLGYRHWLVLNWHSDTSGDHPAAIVRSFYDDKIDYIDDVEHARLWCFGFDMDNMKARCWYDHTLPILRISKQKQALFVYSVSQLIAAAKETVLILRGQVKAAWFNRPADARGDMSPVISSFWQQTETDFYQQLNHLATLSEDDRQTPSSVAVQWLSTIQNTALLVFDQWVMEGDAKDMNMKRIVNARKELEKKINKAKPIKELRQIARAEREVSS